jgi:hypothetical protein
MYNKLGEEEEDEQNLSRALGSYRYCDSTSMHMSKSFGGALVALLKFLAAIDDDGLLIMIMMMGNKSESNLQFQQ